MFGYDDKSVYNFEVVNSSVVKDYLSGFVPPRCKVSSANAFTKSSFLDIILCNSSLTKLLTFYKIDPESDQVQYVTSSVVKTPETYRYCTQDHFDLYAKSGLLTPLGTLATILGFTKKDLFVLNQALIRYGYTLSNADRSVIVELFLSKGVLLDCVGPYLFVVNNTPRYTPDFGVDVMINYDFGVYKPLVSGLIFCTYFDTTVPVFHDGKLSALCYGYDVLLDEGKYDLFLVSVLKTVSKVDVEDFTMADYYYNRLVASCNIPVLLAAGLSIDAGLIAVACYFGCTSTPVEDISVVQSWDKKDGTVGDMRRARGGRNDRFRDSPLPGADDAHYDYVRNVNTGRFERRAIAHGGDDYDWLVAFSKNIRPARFSNGAMAMRSMVFFIDSRRFYMTKHTAAALNEINSFSLFSDKGELLCTYSSDQFVYKFVENQDLVAVTLHRDVGVPGIRDVSKRLNKDVHRPTNKCIRLMKLEKDGSCNLFCTRGEDIEFRQSVITNQYKSLLNEASVKIDGYYLIRSVKGEAGYCMFPYISLDPQHQNTPIIALHVGRVGDDAVACHMNLDDFPAVAQGSTDINPHEKFFKFDQVSDFVPENSEAYFRPVNSCFVPAKSKITKSLIYDFLPDPGMAPARLGNFITPDGVEVSPMANVDAKIAKSVPIGSPPGLYDSLEVTDFFDGLGVPSSCFEWRINSAQEAVSGIPGRLSNMPLNTAAGFPYSGKKKWDFVTDRTNGGGGQLDQEIADASDSLLDLWRKGDFTPQIVTDSLKDEVRDYERVNAGKTRLFNPGGLVEYITIKRVLGEMIRSEEHTSELQS